MAYSSPVWVETRRGALDGGRWLAGDLHVHTCYSHDAYCPPNDDNTGPDEAYTLGLPVETRFAEASARGLDFLAITDHNDVRSSSDPGFDTHGVIGIPAYENSLHGHAQMLGATRLYPANANDASSVQRAARALRADGGLFQINHPVARGHRVTDCSASGLDWGYGYKVRPDSLEVWNLATPQLDDATAWWECWLQRGVRLPATGGSDSHWASLALAQGVGNPTTWVLASQPTPAGVLAALRAGRTSVSRLPPGEGGTPLLLEADANRDGVYESVAGDTVPPRAPMRVRTTGGPGGLVRVRANGATVVDDAPVGATFRAPSQPGWVRAELRFTPGSWQSTLGCAAIPEAPDPTPCAGDQVMAALTSPVYVRAR
jgi:predicted metal-dependent phosphoesterase TrpH